MMKNKPLENKVIKAPSNIQIENFQQSANCLFNFMKKIDYLKFILKNMALIPRYVEENLEYDFPKEELKLAFPMTCFCDINIQKLVYHMKFYGLFGIGLDKRWGISKGIQPILYLNNKSSLNEDMKKAFGISYNTEDGNINEEILSNYLLRTLLFTKPIYGTMFKEGENVFKNFHDEKEWRYIPLEKSLEDLSFFIPQERLNTTAYNTYSEALKQLNDVWLKFEVENIRYIIVNNEESKRDIINFIMSQEVNLENLEKYDLISKILVYSILEEDL